MVVLVDQAAEDGFSSDAVGLEVVGGVRWGSVRAVRWELLPGLVGAVFVVVPDVLSEDGVGVGLVDDEDSVEDFAV